MLEAATIEYLKKQKETEFKFEDVDKLQLAYQLIDNIGDDNSEVRDGLVYPNLAHLLHDKHFTEEQLEEILELLIGPKFLHFDLENYIETSVLTRSFTLLQLVILVYVHNRDNVISGKLIREAFVSFLDYFRQEEKYEGYNQEIGWVHAIAHSADLFAQFVKVEEFGETELKTMFNAITKKIKIQHFFFMYDEDERMVNAIMNGLDREILDEEFLKGWINDFANYEKIKEYPEAYYLTNNIKVFLRSLYFRLLEVEQYDYLVKEIKVVLKENVKLF